MRYRAKNSSSQPKKASLSSGDRFAQSMRSTSVSCFGVSILGTDATVLDGGGGGRETGAGSGGDGDEDGTSGRVSRRIAGGGPVGKAEFELALLAELVDLPKEGADEAEVPALRNGGGGAGGFP